MYFTLCAYQVAFLSIENKVEAVVPFMGESVTDGTLANFLKSMFSLSPSQVVLYSVTNIFFESEPGDRVEADEPIAQIETDKVLVPSVLYLYKRHICEWP